jgi:hypothetical protein
MSHPHVEVLFYRFVSLDDRHDFSQAGAWQGNLGGFRCRLDAGALEARPRGHHATTRSAREALEPHLRSWTLWLELTEGMRAEFKPGPAQVVDTTSSGGVAVEAETISAVTTINSVTVRQVHGSYPPPPPITLAASPLVEELLGWVRDLREGRQRLLVLAYLVFTRLAFEYGDEVRAGAELKVSRKVLVTLRRLAAKNDPERA